MRKIKDWLLLRFLPAWAKESVYAENRRLRERIEEKRHELDRWRHTRRGLNTHCGGAWLSETR